MVSNIEIQRRSWKEIPCSNSKYYDFGEEKNSERVESYLQVKFCFYSRKDQTIAIVDVYEKIFFTRRKIFGQGKAENVANEKLQWVQNELCWKHAEVMVIVNSGGKTLIWEDGSENFQW